MTNPKIEPMTDERLAKLRSRTRVVFAAHRNSFTAWEADEMVCEIDRLRAELSDRTAERDAARRDICRGMAKLDRTPEPLIKRLLRAASALGWSYLYADSEAGQ
jgi:hypothetical protein